MTQIQLTSLSWMYLGKYLHWCHVSSSHGSCIHDKLIMQFINTCTVEVCNIPLKFHTGSMEWKANFPFPIPHTTEIHSGLVGMLGVEWKAVFHSTHLEL